MISVENLSFIYDGSERRALNEISLRIPRGAFVGVTGASRSGKSTLLRAMAGIVPHYLRGRFFGAVKVGAWTRSTPLRSKSRISSVSSGRISRAR